MTNTTAIKKQEMRLRRALNKHGYALHKSRKSTGIDNLGGYMIVDLSTNACVGGSRYDLTLDDVLDWVEYLLDA